MRFLLRLSSLAVFAALCVGRLAADEVHLRDGRIIDGEVVSQPADDTVRVRRGSGSMVVIQHFAARDVDHVVYGISDLQRKTASIAAARAELGTGGDAAEWWALVERARDLGDTGLARDLAQQVVLRDRQHQPARRLLGMVQVKGVWMRPNEAAVATGLVLDNGRWVTWRDHEEQLAADARQKQAVAARRQAAQALRTRTGGDVLPYAAIDVPGYSTSGYANGVVPLYPRIVTWPTYGYGTGGGLVIHGGGQTGNGGWSFRWGL